MVDAALAIIAQEGTAALTKSRVCEHAGMHRSGFYSHFDDLEALLVAAADYLPPQIVESDPATLLDALASHEPDYEPKWIGEDKA